MKGTIKCDKCNWKSEVGEMEKWHNVRCLDCSGSVIIDDKDMAIIEGLKSLEKLGIISTDIDNPDKKGIKVRLHSQELKQLIKDNL